MLHGSAPETKKVADRFEAIRARRPAFPQWETFQTLRKRKWLPSSPWAGIFPPSPADFRVWHAVDRRGVRLDIDQGRTVQSIHTSDPEKTPASLQELNDAKADWIRTVGGAGRENPVHFRSPRGTGLQKGPVSPILPVKNEEVGALFDVEKGRRIRFVNFQRALFVPLPPLERGFPFSAVR
jgi:hypothetical protein